MNRLFLSVVACYLALAVGVAYSSDVGMTYGRKPVHSADAVVLGRGADGDLLYAVQLPPNDSQAYARLRPNRDCRLRCTLVGSHEQLIVGERKFVSVAGADANGNVRLELGNLLRRYATLRKWPQKDLTNDLLLFVRAESTDGGRLEIGAFSFYARKPISAKSYAVSKTVSCQRKVGALVFTHTATTPVGEPTLAEYRIRYEDGTDESVWVESNWNCGFESQVGSGDQSAGGACTWWGPTGFPKAEIIRHPIAGRTYQWTADYTSRYVVQHPEKEIGSVELRSNPKSGFKLHNLDFLPPEETVVGVVEAEEGAVLTPGRLQCVEVMEYAAVPRPDGETHEIFLEKRGGRRLSLGFARMRRIGRLGWGESHVRLPDDESWTGPVRFVAGKSASSWLGLMPRRDSASAEFHYSMITTGQECYEQYDWLRRMGYDMVKTHTIGWGFDPQKWREKLELIRSAGLTPALRPEYAARFKIVGERQPVAAYHPSKGDHIWDHDFAWDLGDERSREAVREYYRRIVAILKTCPPIASIEPCYGVTRGVGGPGNALAPGLRLWESYKRDLSRRFPNHDFSGLTLRDVWEDEREGLLEALIRHGIASNRLLQDEISGLVERELPDVRQVYHTGWRDSEHTLEGRDFPGYLRMCEKLRNGSLCNAASERFSTSFEQWLAGRTFGLRHCDEACQNPPTYEHIRRAYLHMAAFQTVEGNYCRFSVGRPCAFNVGELKPFAALLADAEYLPDPVGFARSFESGYAQLRDTVRNPRHTQVMGHHALINFCQGVALNPDRYLLDAFPDKDAGFAGRVLIDDLNVCIPDGFAERIASFVERGGHYVVFGDVDCRRKGAVLSRFGLSSDGTRFFGYDSRVADSAMPYVIKAFGKGSVVGFEGSVPAHGWETADIPRFKLRAFAKALTDTGRFRMNVCADDARIGAFSYRAKDGDVLLYLVNANPFLVRTDAGIRNDLVAGGTAHDYLTGAEAVLSGRDGYWVTNVAMEPYSAALLRFRPEKSSK